MRAIIPVAGFGTRLKPHTYSLPKVLLNVGGKPIIAHIIEKLLEEKINKATFIIGYMGDKISEYISSHYPQLEAEYVEQTELLGLGHAVYMATPTFNDEEVFIVLGDTIFDVDLHKIFSLTESAIGIKEVEDPSRFGVTVLENDYIVKMVEKPKELVSKLAIVGLYYIKNAALLTECLKELIDKEIQTRGEFQLTDALQLMIDKGEKLKTFPVEGWYDCGKPETLLSTNQFLLTKNGTNRTPENVVIIHPVFISEKAKVSNCVLGPYTTIASNCVVTDSVIKNSIISPGAHVDKSLLDNSIIGTDAVVKGSLKRLNAGDSSEIEFF